MRPTKGIYWLSSYPKSGNTWFRIVLANILNTSNKPIDLNTIQTGVIASARGWVDDVLNFDSSLLNHEELDNLRPLIYKWKSNEKDKVGYHKIHDAYTYLADKTPLIPTEGCLGALYFIRNPLDVAISFANHSQCSIDQAIENMGNPNFAFCQGKYRQHQQLRQWLCSWSQHVQSWVSAKNLNLQVVRYEDMKANPFETFTKAIQFFHIPVTEEQIEQAVNNAHIEKLQSQEQESGFNEKPIHVQRFFRKGIVGDWKNTLNEAQIQKIIQDHAETMQTFGYLDDHLNPVI